MEDMELLKVLENDPRATISDLADILNESEEEVVKTKARLEHDRIICGYHTVINWDKTNTDRITAIIEVSAKPERDTGYDTVAEKIGRFSEVTSLYLMSGGERALTVIALLFALLSYQPSPFCILDEIDAPLDDANIQRFADFLRDYAGNTQFIVITHRKGTMECADIMYGVTMEESGVSKLLSVKINAKENE